jgi:hypothetical protein
MDFLVAFGSVVLLVGFIVVLGYPLLGAHRSSDSTARDRRQLVERREQLYAAIKELDFDHQTGKLPAADHQDLRRPLESEALIVLRQLDSSNGDGETALLQGIEKQILALRHHKPAVCRACGAGHRAGDRFCPQCGDPLQDEDV